MSLLIACKHAHISDKRSADCISKYLLSAAKQKELGDEINVADKRFKLDTLFQKKARLQNFNGTVLVAQRGVILYENAFGYADFKNKTPLTLNHRFQLASVSKTFTGVAILMLVQDGKLNLTDSVRKFLPDFPYNGIRIIDLLSHRSGLPNYVYAFEKKRDGISRAPSNDSILKWFAKSEPVIPPYSRPGLNFSYNNTNFVVLASIIERVTGRSYVKFMNETIFSPLGMNYTGVDTLCADSIRYLNTVGHHGSTSRSRDFYDGVYGDKGIFSTVGDLFRWYVALKHHCLLDKHWTREAFTPRSKEKRSRHNYGLGFRLMTDPKDMDDVKYIYHGGWWAGYNTLFWYSQKDDFVIIILSNRRSNNVFAIRQILEILEDTNVSPDSNGGPDLE